MRLEKLWEKSKIEEKAMENLEAFILKEMWQRHTKAGKTYGKIDTDQK